MDNQLDQNGNPTLYPNSPQNYVASAVRVYNGNPNLKSAGVPINFEPWQVEEWIKCREDPIYFIEKYIKVVTIDYGLQPMKMYEFQKKIAKGILIDSSRVVATCARQMGKCVNENTIYVVRNKKTGAVGQITAKEFHDTIKRNRNEKENP